VDAIPAMDCRKYIRVSRSSIKRLSQKTDIADTPKDGEDIQQLSEISIKDLLSGKSEDIASVVSRMAKTEISFKAFAGIKNELIEAYRETMNSSL